MGAMDECCFPTEFGGGSDLDPVGNGVDDDPVTSGIEDAVRVLLRGLGEDLSREGIRSTPRRVAKAFREGTRGYSQKVKDIVQGAVFTEGGLDNGWRGKAGGDGGLVLVRDLDLYSYCELCLLPFRIKCHVGYIPSSQRVLGLSKIARVADMFSKRLQEPCRLASDICSALHSGINPTGVAVALNCSHIHFPLSGAGPGPHSLVQRLVVSSGSGVFHSIDGDMWVDFLSLLNIKKIPVHIPAGTKPIDFEHHSWCPLSDHSSSMTHPEMVSVVTTILKLLGEDPCRRRELSGTASRFVQWLLRFKNHGSIAPVVAEKIHPKGGAPVSEIRIHFAEKIPFWSLCEHHLLPFHGVVHVGYMGAEGEPGGFEPETVVRLYSRGLQVQERLTRLVAEGVAAARCTRDVIVVVEAEHTCMSSRGVEEFHSSTATVAVLGRFSDHSDLRAAFFKRISAHFRHHSMLLL